MAAVSLLALALMPGAVAGAASCFTNGVMYNGTAAFAAPGYVRSAEDCAAQCRAIYPCHVFTYRAQANKALGFGAGSCQKFGLDQAGPLVAAPGDAADTVSGPKNCDTTTLAGTTLVPSVTAGPTVPASPTVPVEVPTTVVPGTLEPVDVPTTIAVTLPPMVTIAPTMTPSPPLTPTVPTIANIIPSTSNSMGIAGGAFHYANDTVANWTNGTGVPPIPDSPPGFPWWAIVLIAAVLLAIGAAVLFGMCDSGKGKKKAKKAKKSKKSSREEQLDYSEAQALMRTEAPPPMVEAQQEVQTQLAAAPAAQLSGTQLAVPVATSVAAPATTTTYLQPAFGSQAPVYSGGQVVYVQQQQPVLIQQSQPVPVMQTVYREPVGP